MAAIQLRHGVQVRHHETLGRDEACRAGHLSGIEGFAWSGNGTIKAVDVTVDGGKTWREAVLEEPVLDRCLTRFRYVWDWDGGPAKIASRAVDSGGYVQPTVAEIAKARALVGFVQHHNGIFPWSVSEAGEVKNAIA